MCEEPWSLFGESLPAYFNCLIFGYALAIYLGVRWAKSAGLDHDVVIDLGLYALIWGVLGGRVLHVLADGYFWDYVHLCTDPSLVSWEITQAECLSEHVQGTWSADTERCHPVERDCFAWARFWQGGLAYYGGLIFATAFAYRFLKKEGFPFGKAADMAGMTVPLGLFWGRMGCFLGGCCFGQQTDHAIGVSFPRWSSASRSQWKDDVLAHPSLESLPVHATQLYEAIGCLAIAAFAMLVVRPRKRFDGQVMLVFLGLYALLRFGLEYVRADDRGAILGLSTSQFIGVLILVGVAWVWRKLATQSAKAS